MIANKADAEDCRGHLYPARETLPANGNRRAVLETVTPLILAAYRLIVRRGLSAEWGTLAT